MFGSAYALYDDSHLLLTEKICRSLDICSAACIENGCIYALYGLSKHSEHLILVLYQRHHICGIYTGKRLVTAILEFRT